MLKSVISNREKAKILEIKSLLVAWLYFSVDGPPTDMHTPEFLLNWFLKYNVNEKEQLIKTKKSSQLQSLFRIWNLETKINDKSWTEHKTSHSLAR